MVSAPALDGTSGAGRPDRAEFARPTVLAVVTLGAAASFALLLGLIASGVLDSADRRALLSFHDHLVSWGIDPLARNVFSVVASVGRGAVLPLAFAILAVAWLLRHRLWLQAFAVSLLLEGGALLEELVKNAVGRERPHLVAGIDPGSGFAFPSGHATTAMCGILAPALILAPPLSRRAGRALIVAAIIAAVLIDLSRVVLMAHWPSDVVGGALLGTAWSAGVWAAALWWQDRKGAATPGGST